MLTKKIQIFLTGLSSAFLSMPSFGATTSIVGNWVTVDHKTNKPSSIIHIWQEKNKYYGDIAKIFAGPKEQPPAERKCTQCKGKLYNHPMLGLTIIRNLVQKSDSKYMGGTILDARSGKEYKLEATVLPGGKELKIRGYIGFSLLGGNDVWYRAKR